MTNTYNQIKNFLDELDFFSNKKNKPKEKYEEKNAKKSHDEKVTNVIFKLKGSYMTWIFNLTKKIYIEKNAGTLINP